MCFQSGLKILKAHVDGVWKENKNHKFIWLLEERKD